MATPRLLDRVGFTTATTGTGTITVGAAITDATNGDFYTPAEAGAVDGDVFPLFIIDGHNVEVNTGTYTASGTTLTRNTPSSSKIAGTIGTTKLTLSGNALVFFGLTTAVMTSRSVRVVTASGAVTVTTADNVVIVNKASGAATTVNLNASPATGQAITIKDGKGDAETNNITVTPATGTIDGASTFVIARNYGAVDLAYNGTEWNIV